MSELLSPELRSPTKKKKKEMLSYLPPEVITLILSRLPVKSAVKCTAVCKAWYALIKDPTFIPTHLQQAASLQDDDLLLHGFHYFHLCWDNGAFVGHKKLRLPFKSGDFKFLGTCNGLICLVNLQSFPWDVILWNPCIRRHFILPKPDVPYGVIRRATLGFGFDSLSNDYKVLFLVVFHNDGQDSNEAWLFSLNKCSWRRITEVSPKHRCCTGVRQMAFVNGALHWHGFLNYDAHSHVMFAFDLSTEKFHVMSYPNTPVHFHPDMSVIKYEESIAVIIPASHGYNRVDSWVMKEYGVNSSWTNVLHPTGEGRELVIDAAGLMDVYGVRKNGELLVNVTREHGRGCELATLDLNCHQSEQRLKRLGIRTQHGDSYVGSFVESLVLFDKGEQDAKGRKPKNRKPKKRY
ncbi:unnamed protein product [Cuscuta campestris]|uniref:F-box domain-containing protein n=1 Tax=Cuscuta campestris TaxID=132261 RepID=A0A484MBP8_9ASTE|nr:unnamed protein product [Cuscuta campestris]